MMMIAAAAAATTLAGCPTYSPESRGEEAVDHEPEVVSEAALEAEDETVPAEEVESAQAEEPVDPRAPVMHREAAGEPDDTGWYEATSTNGRFRVEVPGAFDDYELSPEDDHLMHVVQAEHEGVHYLVQCSEGGDTPEEKLAMLEEQLPHIGEVEQQRRVRHAGGEGIEFRLSGGGSTVSIRSLAFAHALCELIVEARDTAYPERDGARFMESFAVVDGNG
jgi:hypothetical protein